MKLEPKVTTIMEAKDMDKITLDDIMEALTAHEINTESLWHDEEKTKRKNSKR